MSNRKKIAIIGTVGVPANYGGFETLAEHLIHDLGTLHDITVYCSGKKYKKKSATYKGAKLKYIPLDANGIQSIPYDTLSILHALIFSDVLLVLGVAGAWILPFVRWFTNKKIIISIDGIEWKRDKWNLLAKWYLFWAESLAVKYSHIDISDNEAIQDYTAERYGTLSRIIEYGADHAIDTPKDSKILQEVGIPFKNYAFKVCRIVPENNVHLILDAFDTVQNLPLVIVGNWANSNYGRLLKIKYQNHKNIYLLDPIYDQIKLDVIRSNAMLYVHGHSAGGTNPSLVEAMYLGLPVLAYGVSYNKVTTENKALYFQNKEELTHQLQNLYLVKLYRIGQLMKNIAYRRYKWGIVTDKYNRLIEEVSTVSHKQSVKNDLSLVGYATLLKLGLAHFKTAKTY